MDVTTFSASFEYTWTSKMSPPSVMIVPLSFLAVILNSTGCPHSVLYMIPSCPCPMVTVDIPACATLSVATQNFAISCSSSLDTLSSLNVKTLSTHGSSFSCTAFNSCNRLIICLCMFKISTSQPFSKAFSVKSTPLCTHP